MGVMHATGQGVPQNYEEAIKWYRLSAAQGEAGAQSNLGYMYSKGQGVQQDHKEAIKWYSLAANQGHAIVQNNLGNMHKAGQGTPQDFKEAMKWYRLAANQGNAKAQTNLGLMYENGQSVAASRVIAYALFNVSAAGDASNENPAASHRNRVAQAMPPAEIDAAQDLTRELLKQGYFLTALDNYAKNPAVKEPPK
jgi:TPR repeat protein